MNTAQIYPWQQRLWHELATQTAHLPHALLFKGAAGLGKLHFALVFAQRLLCLQPTEYACGQCQSCHWFLQGNHPDFALITPEDAESAEDSNKKSKTRKKEQISVDQIRALADFVTLSSHRQQGRRVVLIHPAEALNVFAANALLKMLEEPPSGVVFLLVSHQPQRLLATIISRCRQVDMPTVSPALAQQWLAQQEVENAEHWLNLAGGAPLRALEYAKQELHQHQNIIQQLEKGAALSMPETLKLLNVLEMREALSLLQKWVYDLTSWLMLGQIRYFGQSTAKMRTLTENVEAKRMLQWAQSLQEAQKLSLHPLNNDLQLEQLLLQYQQLFKKK